MATKDHCLFLKGDNQHFVSSNQNGHQYSNLNLNANQKCSSILETFQSNKSISTSNFNSLQKNNDYANNKALDENIIQSKNNSSSWNKSDDNVGGSNIYLNNSNIFGSTKIGEATHEDEMDSKKSSSNNGTLSLHITAYENSVEAQNELNAAKNDGTNLSKRKINKVLEVLNVGFASMDAFEIPRQQTTEKGPNEPEIMGFKASQKLLNPTQPPASSLDTTTFSILGHQKLKILVKVFIDKNQVNVIRNDFDEVISVKKILPNIFEKANLSSKEFVIQSINVFDRKVLDFVSVSDDYLLQPFDKFELYLTKKIQETEMFIQESGTQEPQKSIIDTSKIQNIKDLTDFLSAKLDVKDGGIKIQKFDDDFGGNITVNDEEKFDPTNVYNSQVTKIMKFSGVVRPRLIVSSNNSIDQPNRSDSQTKNAIAEAAASFDEASLIDILDKLTASNCNEISTEIIKNYNWKDSDTLSAIIELIFEKAFDSSTRYLFRELLLELPKVERRIEGNNCQRHFYDEIIRRCQSYFRDVALDQKEIGAENEGQNKAEKDEEKKIAALKHDRNVIITTFIFQFFTFVNYIIVKCFADFLLKESGNELMLEHTLTFFEIIGPSVVKRNYQKTAKFNTCISRFKKFNENVSYRIQLLIDELKKLERKQIAEIWSGR